MIEQGILRVLRNLMDFFLLYSTALGSPGCLAIERLNFGPRQSPVLDLEFCRDRLSVMTNIRSASSLLNSILVAKSQFCSFLCFSFTRIGQRKRNFHSFCTLPFSPDPHLRIREFLAALAFLFSAMSFHSFPLADENIFFQSIFLHFFRIWEVNTPNCSKFSPRHASYSPS